MGIVYKKNGKTVSREEMLEEPQQDLPYGEYFSFGLGDTDRTFMDGYMNGKSLSQMSPVARIVAMRAARAAGTSISGKQHVSGLGPVTDPSAWVDGIGDVVRVAREKNKTVTINGHVKNKATPVPRPPSKALADDLAGEMVAREVSRDPGLAGKHPQELKEMVTDKYGAKK